MHYSLDKEQASLFPIKDNSFVPDLFQSSFSLLFLFCLFKSTQFGSVYSIWFAFLNMIIDSAISDLCDPTAGHR